MGQTGRFYERGIYAGGALGALLGLTFGGAAYQNRWIEKSLELNSNIDSEFYFLFALAMFLSAGAIGACLGGGIGVAVSDKNKI